MWGLAMYKRPKGCAADDLSRWAGPVRECRVLAHKPFAVRKQPRALPTQRSLRGSDLDVYSGPQDVLPSSRTTRSRGRGRGAATDANNACGAALGEDLLQLQRRATCARCKHVAAASIAHI